VERLCESDEQRAFYGRRKEKSTVESLLVSTYFSQHVGGLEVVVQQPVESLARAGHDVRFVPPPHDSSVSHRRGHPHR
jgi:hypothetical protein